MLLYIQEIIRPQANLIQSPRMEEVMIKVKLTVELEFDVFDIIKMLFMLFY